MAFRFKSMGYKMKPSSLRSPFKIGEPVKKGFKVDDTKQTTTKKVVESITDEEPKKTVPVATGDSPDYNPSSLKREKSSKEDPTTGYYNPFETLAKVILTPDTERAKQRVKERQQKRLAKVSKPDSKGNVNTKKIERVKARQADVRKQRGID